MDLVGCSCAGFSYTDKYCEAMEEFYGWLCGNYDGKTYEYNDLQHKIANNIKSDESEIRMLVPFMLKAGILNESCVIRGGSRIRKIILAKNLITENGERFLQFLKVYNQRKILPKEAKERVMDIFYKFGYIQFEKLYNGEEPIYKDVISFLNKFDSIDKNEFFILTTLRSQNRMAERDNIIQMYRNNQIADINIVSCINAYQYIMKLLIALGVVRMSGSAYKLTDMYKGDVFNV